MQEAQGPLGESKKTDLLSLALGILPPRLCPFPEGAEWLSRVRFRSPTTNVAMLALRRCLRHGTRGGAAGGQAKAAAYATVQQASRRGGVSCCSASHQTGLTRRPEVSHCREYNSPEGGRAPSLRAGVGDAVAEGSRICNTSPHLSFGPSLTSSWRG